MLQKSKEELKKQNECIITRHFLRYYNKAKGGNLTIVGVDESPDIICKDSDSKRIGIEVSEWLIQKEVGKRKEKRRKNPDGVRGGSFNPKEHTQALRGSLEKKFNKKGYRELKAQKDLKQFILVIYLGANALFYNPPGWLVNFNNHIKAAKKTIIKTSQNYFDEIWVFKAFKPDGAIYQIYPNGENSIRTC